MKKIIYILLIASVVILFSFILILSTLGIETVKFNNIISKKIYQANNNLSLKLNTIKFKINTKELSLFLETVEPKINYRETTIPAQNIKVYVDVISLVKSNLQIKKINLTLRELNVKQLKQLSSTVKPSTFKSIINNKVEKGKFYTEMEFYLDENNAIKNFIVKGKVLNLSAKIADNLILENTNLNFFADKTDILIKNIFGELDGIKLIDGDIKLKFAKEISLRSNFLTNLNLNKNSLKTYEIFFDKFEYFEDIINLKAELNNNLLIDFDTTYKIKNFDLKSTGKILDTNIKFKKPFTSKMFPGDVNELSLIGSKIDTNFNKNKKTINISGKYSINGEDHQLYNLKNNINKNLLNLELKIEYSKKIILEFLNYKKKEDNIANLSINLIKEKNKITIKEINLSENNNSILAENIELDENKILSFKKIKVKTFNNDKKNNDFSILNQTKILIKGSHFDATALPKFLGKTSETNIISRFNKEIEIDFKNVIAPLSENLKNFKLIGIIKKGKFVKILSKGDFGNNNFLDISMKNDKLNKKKYFEIYSDLTHPLLTEYSFFKGLVGGKLFFTSIIDGNKSDSKLVIENFKVINAPGIIKLLSLADLGGLADLAEGEGLSFDLLEINMNNSDGFLKLNEILAVGPSISVIMEGYQDKRKLTSLRGTLVPAKNLNKLISKIPVLGSIIIPKEAGEGLFGISFKMKGPPGKIKTTINPIKTITPRFIQKIIEKGKTSK